MYYLVSTVILLLAGTTATFAQAPAERSTREPIRIDIQRQFHHSPARTVATFFYNEQGEIRFIASRTLHPVADQTADQYWAEYQYGTGSRLEQELLYGEREGVFRVLRTTQYTYREDTLFVTVHSNTGELLANMREWPTDTGVVRKYGYDHVLIGGPEHARNLTVYARYRNDELVAHTTLHDSVDYRGEITTRWEGNKQIITYREQGKYRNEFGSVYHFHDRRGRLRAIGTTPRKKSWHTRFAYGKNGLISRITVRGRISNTEEMVRSHLLINAQRATAGNLTDAACQKINREIRNMYQPTTGRMRYLNFFDSRRFMSH